MQINPYIFKVPKEMHLIPGHLYVIGESWCGFTQKAVKHAEVYKKCGHTVHIVWLDNKGWKNTKYQDLIREVQKHLSKNFSKYGNPSLRTVPAVAFPTGPDSFVIYDSDNFQKRTNCKEAYLKRKCAI